MLRILTLLALLTAPAALANPLNGSDAAAFTAAFDALLRRDSEPALRQLHSLAETGNTAALVALPLALRWALNRDPALRRIQGTGAQVLAEQTHKPTALWQEGEISPTPREQLNRALWLYELGEIRKGDALLEAWFNHMPETAPLPEGFADLPAAPVLKAMILLQHMTRGNAKALPVLQYFLDQDRIEGWMVLAQLTDHYTVTGGQPAISRLVLGDNMGARLADGRRAYRLLWRQEPPPPLPEDVVQMMLRDLMPRPQFAPVRAFCQAACPETAASCATAFVQLLGAPHPATAALTPLHDLMDEDSFFATPRGAQSLLAPALRHRLLLERAKDPAQDLAGLAAFASARSLDSCFADAAIAALQPMPQNP